MIFYLEPYRPITLKWEELPSSLKAHPHTKWQDRAALAWNILSFFLFPIGLLRAICYGIKIVTRNTFLPGTEGSADRLKQADTSFKNFWSSQQIAPEVKKAQDKLRASNHFYDKIRSMFIAEEHIVITPDGCELRIKLLRYIGNGNRQLPTVIQFNRNAELALENPNPWFLTRSIQKKSYAAHFVFFDYRGAGHSTGTVKSAKDLAIDGSSVVQWVRKYLKTPPDKIHFYGKSLGGAIAAQTQALDPELTGSHVNERSFSSTENVIKSWYCWGVSSLVNWIVRKCHFNIDVTESFKKIKGRKLIVYHPQDQVIPKSANLIRYQSDEEVLELKPKNALDSNYRKRILNNPGFTHCAPIHYHENAPEKIMRFLFEPSTNSAKYRVSAMTPPERGSLRDLRELHQQSLALNDR